MTRRNINSVLLKGDYELKSPHAAHETRIVTYNRSELRGPVGVLAKRMQHRSGWTGVPNRHVERLDLNMSKSCGFRAVWRIAFGTQVSQRCPIPSRNYIRGAISNELEMLQIMIVATEIEVYKMLLEMRPPISDQRVSVSMVAI